MTFEDKAQELVKQSLWYDRLYDMGMIGPTGMRASKEANRRRSKIHNMMRDLGITPGELKVLKAHTQANGEKS